MNLKSALSMIAFGFLFIIVNWNIRAGDLTVNILPECIGWLLLFPAFDSLGPYGKNRKYLKWAALVLAVFTAALWILRTFLPEADILVPDLIRSVLSPVYMYGLFGVLLQIARDFDSPVESWLRTLRILNLVLALIFAALSLDYLITRSDPVLLAAGIVGIAAAVPAFITIFVLFALRKEIAAEQEKEEADGTL